jgi:hypothetical protein
VELSFVLHVIGIMAPVLWLGRVLRMRPALHIGLTFLTVEASLVVGAGLLTWAGLLGHLRAYQLVTTLCAVAITTAIWWIAQSDALSSPRPGDDAISAGAAAPISNAWSAVPIACLGIFAFGMLVLALSSYPAVEDSLTIKLPKIVFSIQGNSYLPSDQADDPRMYMSPVYPALVQLFLIANGQTTHALLVLGLVHWVVCAAAVYQMCRNVGASAFAGWTVTALALLTPMLIVQGSSEGDDIIAATPFLLALMFFTSWLNNRRYFHAALAGAGLGLSTLMKFLPLFYAPAVPLILVLALVSFKGSATLAWIRGSLVSGGIFCAALCFVALPHLVGNWAAFGNPLYVSKSVAATSNSPFDIGCGLRGVVGYTSQLGLADAATLAKRMFKRVFMHYDHTPMRNENAVAAVKNLGDVLTGLIPFHPVSGCTAWGNVFSLGSDFISDNTVWYGVFGPLLLICTIVVLLSRKEPFPSRALALSLLAWIVTFAMTQRYLADIGRYWSMMMLAGTPVTAIAVDRFLWRVRAVSIRGLALLAVSFATLIFGLQVLVFNAHRSFGEIGAAADRYSSGFPAEFRAMMKAARSVNIQVAYGIDTYDYYMLLGEQTKLASKIAVLSDTINVVIVRPFGFMENPYSDPRIPVRLKEPFRGGFQYVGKVRPQPGSEYNLGFANHTEMLDGGKLDPRSAFLLFQGQQIRKEGDSILGQIYYISSPEAQPKTRFRVGWRDHQGRPVIDGEWNRGVYAAIKVPEDATALIIQAALDSDENEGTAEWSLRGFDASIVDKLSEDREVPRASGLEP